MSLPAAGSVNALGWDMACLLGGACLVAVLGCGSSEPDFRVIVTNQGGGTVVSAPEGIDCGTACDAMLSGDEATLLATPYAAHRFAGWVNGCGPAEECVVFDGGSGSAVHVEAVFSSCEKPVVRCGSLCVSECQFDTCGDGEVDPLELCLAPPFVVQGVDDFGFDGSPATGDVEGDGDADLAVSAGADFATLLVNDGTGGFAAERTPFLVEDKPGGSGVSGLLFLDLDGTGGDELISGNGSHESIGVHARQPDGTYLHEFIPMPGVPYGLGSGEVDGDGAPDLVVYVIDWPRQTGGVVVLAGDGNGGLEPPAEAFSGLPFVNGGDGAGLALSDVDGDGDLDAGVVTGGTLYISTNDEGAFAFPVVITEAETFALGDLDDDGDADVVATLFLQDDTGGHDRIMLVENLGEDGFAAPEVLVVAPHETFFMGPELVDLDRDDHLDIALLVGVTSIGTTDFTMEMVLLRNDGSGKSFLGLAAYPGALWAAFGDFQLDGAVDVITFDAAGAHVALSDP